MLNGRKWWITNVFHPHCRIMIVMGKTQPDAPTYTQQSQILVPLDTPGVTVLRNLPVFGYIDQDGHGEIDFEDVRVPATNVIAKEGDGFMIAQARLGPGRIHHCMRAIGAAERALEAMCKRAVSRVTFGQPIATRGNIQDWIAESRIEIEMARLLTLKAAWMMDTVGNRHARTEIAAIKVAAPNVALKVLDRAIQVHGGGGVSEDFGLASRLRAPAHAAPRRRPRRGPQALDRAARAGALHAPRGWRASSLSALIFAERPAAGDAEGLLILHHGRGADEHDLLTLADVLDPATAAARGHAARAAAAARLPRLSLVPGAACRLSRSRQFDAAYAELATLHDELWAANRDRARAHDPRRLLDGRGDELRARARTRGVPCRAASSPSRASSPTVERLAARSRRPQAGCPCSSRMARRDQVIDVGFARAARRAAARGRGSRSTTTSPRRRTTSTQGSCRGGTWLA